MPDITIKEIEKLVHCLNSLKHIRHDVDKATTIWPGLNRIIQEADEMLFNHPELIPTWYKSEPFHILKEGSIKTR